MNQDQDLVLVYILFFVLTLNLYLLYIWKFKKKDLSHYLFIIGCYVAYGILVPRPGIKPVFLAVEAGVLTIGSTEKSIYATFYM